MAYHFPCIRNPLDTWKPEFIWVPNAAEASELINKPYEDYPKYVLPTIKVIEHLVGTWTLKDLAEVASSNWILKYIHYNIFQNSRDVKIRAEDYIPPDLKLIYPTLTMENLESWYVDFEIIHPFQDGNGRVGGVVIASISHLYHPDKGFLALKSIDIIKE